MIQDIHSHTYYSFCGGDRPEEVVEKAIAGGIELFGICDHNYGVGFGRPDLFATAATDISTSYGRNLVRYFDHINLIKEKYADKIKILRGIEIATLNDKRYPLPDGVDISFFDYCLIEHIDCGYSVSDGDLFSFAKRCGCQAGVAHTDLFKHAESLGIKPLDYFKRMAEENIFWEMNVSYDSIHGYREHKYMLRFFESEAEQEIIRESGVKLSVGFDGHRCNEYLPDRVKDYCGRIEKMGIPMIFDNK